MVDFDTLSLDRSPAATPPQQSPSGPSLLPFIVVGVLLLALGALWYFGRAHTARHPANPAVTETTVNLHREPARPAAEPGEAIDLPPLDESDALMRTLVARLSAHPAIAAWLTTDGLIRNLTVAVVNIAEGDTPAKHLRPLRPPQPFAARESRGAMWIDPSSYSRYDAIASATESLDARGVGRLYATIKPRINDAYQDLGAPDGNVDRTFEKAITMLLRTPTVDHDVQVRQDKVLWQFADPALEELPRAQRQFLRMGPRNMRIVKATLRDVAHHLGIPDAALPPPDGN
jgi:DUF3014 family protein